MLTPHKMKYVVKFCNASHRGIMNKKKLAGMAWCLLTSSTLVKKIAHLRLTMGQGGVHSTNWNPKPSSMAKEVGIKFQKKIACSAREREDDLENLGGCWTWGRDYGLLCDSELTNESTPLSSTPPLLMKHTWHPDLLMTSSPSLFW